jgi:hypothetical protein
VAFAKFPNSPSDVISHNRACLYNSGVLFITCCDSFDKPVAKEVQYSAVDHIHFHINSGVLVIIFLVHCTTFGATYSAPLTSAFPVSTVPVFIAFHIGFANGIGAICDTLSNPAIFSARIGLVFSNSLHHRESS